MATFKRVSFKATKWTEAKESGFEVAVKKGESVEVKCDGFEETRTFKIGDTVYWKYAITALMGKIVKITDNSVFVQGLNRTSTTRFTLAEFADHNFSFNTGEARDEQLDYEMNG
ncbi:hypothetical protein [Vibrio crassostreae]|uniref:hypothetical protein n=1 Tax=Vibrio crassostreae TaxID=246167 RepID=UPI001B3116A9|nr:hypothetical protein [Vibrio crassostreae]